MGPKRTFLAAAAVCAVVAAVTAPPTAAQPRRPAPAAAAPAAQGESYDAASYDGARAAFEKLPEAERKAIQEALVWTGDHIGVTTGGFGRRTYDAIVAYQTRARLKPDGILDERARAALRAAAEKVRAGLKFAILRDPKTGVAIGVPQAVLPKRDVNPNGGARFQSADGKITLDTRAFPAGETDLPALYERNLAIQTPGRQITYKVLRPDFFVVSGETATGKFYMRYASGPGGVRGFSLGYDKALARSFDKTVIAIANSFVAFPEMAPAAGANVPAPPPRPAIVEPRRPRGPIATGLLVAGQRVLTSAAVEACLDLRVGPSKARVVKSDKAAGLALVELEAGRPAVPLRLRPEALAADTPVVALLFTASAALSVVPGEAASPTTLIAPLQPGASGAPIFDRSGALAGMVGAMPAAPRLVAGIVPPARYPMTPASDVARFLSDPSTLAADGGAPAKTAGDIAAAAAGAVVAIECGR